MVGASHYCPKTTQSERGAPIIVVSELLKTNICNMWGLTDLIN